MLKDDETILSRLEDAPSKKRTDISTLKLLRSRKRGAFCSAFTLLVLMLGLLVAGGIAVGITAAIDPSVFGSSASEKNVTTSP